MKKFFKSKKRIVLAIGSLLILAFIGYQIFKPKTIALTGTIQKGEVKSVLTLSGEINSDQSASLQFQQGGKIAWIAVKDGQWVGKGQGLMGLDALKINSAYEIALSNLRAADATVEKIHDDVKGHSGDETFAQKVTRTTAEVSKDNAYEAMKMAKKDLNEATLVSPVSGYVTLINNPVVGVNILPGIPQVQIANPQSIYLSVAADQTDVVNLKIGDAAEIILDAYPNETLTGKVVSIGVGLKPGETGTVYEAKIALTSVNIGQIKYRLGMTGDASFTMADKQDVLYIDSQFIKEDAKGKYLLVGREKKKVYIKTGIEGDIRTEIIEGNVKDGEIVS